MPIKCESILSSFEKIEKTESPSPEFDLAEKELGAITAFMSCAAGQIDFSKPDSFESIASGLTQGSKDLAKMEVARNLPIHKMVRCGAVRLQTVDGLIQTVYLGQAKSHLLRGELEDARRLLPMIESHAKRTQDPTMIFEVTIANMVLRMKSGQMTLEEMADNDMFLAQSAGVARIFNTEHDFTLEYGILREEIARSVSSSGAYLPVYISVGAGVAASLDQYGWSLPWTGILHNNTSGLTLDLHGDPDPAVGLNVSVKLTVEDDGKLRLLSFEKANPKKAVIDIIDLRTGDVTGDTSNRVPNK